MIGVSKNSQTGQQYDAVPNEYKDSFEDTADCVDELPRHLQKVVRRNLRKQKRRRT